jgi:hypothetical protein
MSLGLSLNTIVEEVVSQYSDTSLDNIDYLINQSIQEVIPQAIWNVRVPTRPFDQFEIRKRELRSGRRSKSWLGGETYSSENDPEVIIRIAKSSLKSPKKEQNSSVLQDENLPYENITSSTIVRRKSTENMSGNKAINKFQIKNSAVSKIRNSSDLTSAGDLNVKSKIIEHSERSISIDISKDLVDLRDTSMSFGRYLSVIEKESTKLTSANDIDIKYSLSIDIPNDSIENEKYILKLSTPSQTGHIELRSMTERLQENIKNKMDDIISKLTATESNEYATLLNKLVVVPDYGKILEPNFDDKLKRLNINNFEFKDIKKILDVALSNYDSNVLSQICNLLKNDIELKREKFGVDCLEKLKEIEGLIPQGVLLKAKRPEMNDEVMKLTKAIILFEYSRLSEIDNQKFLDGKINYDDYLRRNENYINVILDLW